MMLGECAFHQPQAIIGLTADDQVYRAQDGSTRKGIRATRLLGDRMTFLCGCNCSPEVTNVIEEASESQDRRDQRKWVRPAPGVLNRFDHRLLGRFCCSTVEPCQSEPD